MDNDDNKVIELGSQQELAPDIEFNRAVNLAAALFFSRGGSWQVAHAVLCSNAHALIAASVAPQEIPPGSPIIRPGA